MKGVRFISGILFYLARMASLLVVLVTAYATAVLLLYRAHSSFSPPMEVLANGSFRIFFPFTHSPFILGDYTATFLFSSFFTVAFYGLFLWFLSSVFQAFRETRLFTKKGVLRLSRFYLLNFFVPFLFLGMLLIFGEELADLVRIILLHLVIGIFAYFMAAIFKQGVLLQDEQDLTF